MSVLADGSTMCCASRSFFGIDLFVTASIGVAIGNGSTHSADDLLRYADTAMYAVKESGRDGWQFFSESLQEQAQQRLAITNGLRWPSSAGVVNALSSPSLLPKPDALPAPNCCCAGSRRGELSPAVFIPIAEMTGAIVPIGAWVFREACRAEAEWRQRWGEAAPYVSVNVSARQLNDEALAEDFSHHPAGNRGRSRAPVAGDYRTSLMADVETNLRILRRLADLGLRVAVDDFGTGYSSLAQLARLPVNVLKIDRALSTVSRKARKAGPSSVPSSAWAVRSV
jgi:predicted signal transduction protein with EAL and GGDEF domain